MIKRYLFLCLLFSVLFTTARANHITGGEIFYTLTSQNGNNYTYHVTLKLFRHCGNVGAPLDPSAPISVFDRLTGATIQDFVVPMSQMVTLNLGSPDPCINNPPEVCYEVGYYEFDVTLPGSAHGYTITYMRCCRIAGINNLTGSSSVGATYTAEVPGNIALASAPANNSAHFTGTDTVIVCQHTGFTYSFGAVDSDGDSLVYSFCDAYVGGSTNNPAPSPPGPPPYTSVPYASPFSGSNPLGSDVSLNTSTGLISGTAPDAGIYVVTVCVNEYRNGLLIATQRKDLQIKVGDCSLASVNLDPQIVNCADFTQIFTNGGDQSAIHSYFWNFGDPASGANNTSTLTNPPHTFSDTGVFIVTLITNAGETCSDTGTSVVKIFPGFFPGFAVPPTGTCMNHPTQFTDTTKTVYGFVNSWTWNFGVTSTLADSSHVQNPSYVYATPGVYDVQLIVTCSKGCIDTVTNPVTIYDKPPLSLNTKDTLLCKPDSVQLQASGTGAFTWTPATNISNPNISNPYVFPPTTTWYHVTLNDNGCINTDSVRVRVVDHVSLTAQSDTIGCQSDAFQLHAQTDGLTYNWTPAALLDNPDILNPIALSVNTTTTFRVASYIGHCVATDDVKVVVVPYPAVNAGPNQDICFNSATQLHGSFIGTSFSWSPANSLSNAFIANPFAAPSHTTDYILTVYDTIGCPKPGRDTVRVVVRPKINAFAGRDTAVVVGQPLHFHASGGVGYLWSPAIALDNIHIPDPTAVYDGSIDTIKYKVVVNDEAGCVDSAFVTVTVFKVNPQIFVPTAFTPNGDGVNDLFKPLGVGIKNYEYFKVFNRWGQMVFSSSINGQGWDGKLGGKMQPSGTFVWIVKGVDYLDRPFFKKGTVILIQ